MQPQSAPILDVQQGHTSRTKQAFCAFLSRVGAANMQSPCRYREPYALSWPERQGFADVKPVIVTLLPGVLIYNFSILFGHYFSGTGRYSINGRISAIGLVVSVILYFTLIPMFNVRGAGIATSLSYLFTSILFLWYFARENKNWQVYLIPRWSDIKVVIAELKKAKNLN